MKLISYVRETILYKTDVESCAWRYACHETHDDDRVMLRTLEWNEGNPKFKE